MDNYFNLSENYIDVSEAIESVNSKMKNSVFGYPIPPFKLMQYIVKSKMTDGVDTVRVGQTKIGTIDITIYITNKIDLAYTIFGDQGPGFKAAFPEIKTSKGSIVIILSPDFFNSGEYFKSPAPKVSCKDFYEFVMYHEYGHAEHEDISVKSTFKRVIAMLTMPYLNLFNMIFGRESDMEIAADLYAARQLGLSEDSYNKMIDCLLYFCKLTIKKNVAPSDVDIVIANASRIINFRRKTVLKNWKYVTDVKYKTISDVALILEGESPATESYGTEDFIYDEDAMESVWSKTRNNVFGYKIPPYKYVKKIADTIEPDSVDSSRKIGNTVVGHTDVELYVTCSNHVSNACVVFGKPSINFRAQMKGVKFTENGVTLLMNYRYFRDKFDVDIDKYYQFIMYHEYGHVEHHDFELHNKFKRAMQDLSRPFVDFYLYMTNKENSVEMAADIYSCHALGLSKEEYTGFMNQLYRDVIKDLDAAYGEGNYSSNAFQRRLKYRVDTVLKNWKYVEQGHNYKTISDVVLTLEIHDIGGGQ